MTPTEEHEDELVMNVNEDELVVKLQEASLSLSRLPSTIFSSSSFLIAVYTTSLASKKGEKESSMSILR